MLQRILAKVLSPRSFCAGCGRPWFSDRRRPCACGETARLFVRSLIDSMAVKEAARARTPD